MVEREAKKPQPSVYQVGETVLIRYPGSGRKWVKKRYVLEAQVLKRNLEKDLYKVSFYSPISGKKTNKWMSVCDVTSTTMDKENRRTGKKRRPKEQAQKVLKQLIAKTVIRYRKSVHGRSTKLCSLPYLI